MIRSVCKSKMIKPSNKQGKQVIWQVIIKKDQWNTSIVSQFSQRVVTALNCNTSFSKYPGSISSAFYKQRTDPEIAKKTNDLTVFFALSGSLRVKASHRALMKLTPGVK